MTSFSASTLEKKLHDLSNTQQSVQTLSLWLIHHRKHAKTVVQVWNKEIRKVKTSKRLTFMYLANDVLQNSKKKGNEYNLEFKAAMPSAFKFVGQGGDKDTAKGLERLLNIWSERGVFELSFIEKIRKGLAIGSPVESPPPSKKSRIEDDSKDSSPVPAPDVEELIKALQELEESASQDAAVREKIANLPAEVQDVSLLEKIEDKETGERLTRIVDKACVLLAEYNGRLSAELEDRITLSKMLTAFISLQKQKLQEAEKRLEEFRGKLEKVTIVRKELKSHLDNLPDLSKLPDVDGGLAPLPSAGDLFASSSGHRS
ncbi:regulation of nuclear pre-mRNA domain-containing protein 1B [Nematostella vectensis]|uniref:regulation of nuclear pre-mRNA domain-containing protein 1B n=1 Tax=Nematostella vectensis TaxID=45351 RepID=UPI00138FE70F|nr:regulation of nuclear pre-mRNA domain-containing protein 1B [Nematostella vectensis]